MIRISSVESSWKSCDFQGVVGEHALEIKDYILKSLAFGLPGICGICTSDHITLKYLEIPENRPLGDRVFKITPWIAGFFFYIECKSALYWTYAYKHTLYSICKDMWAYYVSIMWICMRINEKIMVHINSDTYISWIGHHSLITPPTIVDILSKIHQSVFWRFHVGSTSLGIENTTHYTFD